MFFGVTEVARFLNGITTPPEEAVGMLGTEVGALFQLDYYDFAANIATLPCR